MKPEMARLTLARKIAAIALTLWKKEERFDTEQLKNANSSLSYNSALRSRRMAGFDEAWAAVDHPKDGESVSPELQPLLRRVVSEVLAAPADLPALKESLTALLEYLGGQGRTNANCWAVDMFFCLSEG